MRHFSFKPTLMLRGRKFKGLRGWAGKPLHPPLTDIPIGAYLLAGGFDIISVIGRKDDWGQEFFHAGTYAFIGGAIVSVFAAVTGFWDWWKSSEAGTQARRTINAHASIMIVVTLLAGLNIILRLSDYHTRGCPTPFNFVVTLLVGLLVSVGASYGGTMVFDYGFNVETAGDSPVWHVSEQDVLPGQK
ncbi:MAG: DUF2231 domain-containing protein [Acidobacteria bacterium]|nr:DUF2231 domain-containing protein [Acidobacteriota bacterium]